MENTNTPPDELQRRLDETQRICSRNAEVICAFDAILRRIVGPPVTIKMLRNLARKAKALRKQNRNLSFCQHLEAITKKCTGLRTYDEALALAKKTNSNSPANKNEPLNRAQFAKLYNRMQTALGSIALCVLTPWEIDDDLWSLMECK